MTSQKINERFAELAVVSGYRAIIDDNSDGVGKERIDFCADPREVLKVMMAKHPEFVESLFSIDEVEYHSWRPQNRSYLFTKYLDYILDTTGKLALAAIEWMEKL